MEFYSPGKLLLTSEYVVLSGALAYAVPTKFGQRMTVEQRRDQNHVTWIALDRNDSIWFEAQIALADMHVLQSTNEKVATRLGRLLQYIRKSTSLLQSGYRFETRLDFDRNWGLGSSSTLVANLAQWSGLDPVQLLHSAFTGSGYDVVVGVENAPILYQLTDVPSWSIFQWHPDFHDQLHFVYLGQKQNSEREVAKFNPAMVSDAKVDRFTSLTKALIGCQDFDSCRQIFEEHEALISDVLGRKTIKDEMFHDYNGAIKSLGAWGGDFVLVLGDPKYFLQKGLTTVFSWKDMVASNPKSMG